MIFQVKHLVLVRIYYFIPDHKMLLNEFCWQTLDLWPTIPRIHKFLGYWKDHIEAPINSIDVVDCETQTWKKIDSYDSLI